MILIFNSEDPGVDEVDGASPDFVELAGVGSDALVDRRGGMVASFNGLLVRFVSVKEMGARSYCDDIAIAIESNG